MQRRSGTKGEAWRDPSPAERGRLGGGPLQKTPSSALPLPCEIVSISQGRPLLAPEFTTSGQEEAGKGLKIPFWEGVPATPPLSGRKQPFTGCLWGTAVLCPY
jgi:hypothetical protein